MRVVTYLVVRFNDVPIDAAGVFVVHLTMTDILFIYFISCIGCSPEAHGPQFPYGPDSMSNGQCF